MHGLNVVFFGLKNGKKWLKILQGVNGFCFKDGKGGKALLQRVSGLRERAVGFFFFFFFKHIYLYIYIILLGPKILKYFGVLYTLFGTLVFSFTLIKPFKNLAYNGTC
jgi:hypothetical protein